MPNQTAETMVEGMICRHGAPAELLSDRGANFMSELVAEVCALFAVKKVNTSGYHPQTNDSDVGEQVKDLGRIGTNIFPMFFMHIASLYRNRQRSHRSFWCMVLGALSRECTAYIN